MLLTVLQTKSQERDWAVPKNAGGTCFLYFSDSPLLAPGTFCLAACSVRFFFLFPLSFTLTLVATFLFADREQFGVLVA